MGEFKKPGCSCSNQQPPGNHLQTEMCRHPTLELNSGQHGVDEISLSLVSQATTEQIITGLLFEKRFFFYDNIFWTTR